MDLVFDLQPYILQGSIWLLLAALWWEIFG